MNVRQVTVAVNRSAPTHLGLSTAPVRKDSNSLKDLFAKILMSVPSEMGIAATDA
jgi:hypothetical protein